MTLYIAIGCDTDPDRSYFVPDIPENSLGWRGMLEGIPRAKSHLRSIHDSDGHDPILTWLLRVDHQVKEVHGSYDYILTEYRDFLLNLETGGDELGWHPHFWAKDNASDEWRQNFEDIDWQVDMLRLAWAAYQKALPGRAKSVRMGWTYHNNRTLATLAELGVLVDMSPIPGMRVLPGKSKVVVSNFYDWSQSPDNPYYPAVDDYRQAATETGKALSIVAAPNFVSHSLAWSALSGLVMTKKMKDPRLLWWALTKPAFLSTITCNTSLFKPNLTRLRKRLKTGQDLIYVAGLHADELIENTSGVYTLENMEQNIRSLLTTAEKAGARVKFIRASEIADLVPPRTTGQTV